MFLIKERISAVNVKGAWNLISSIIVIIFTFCFSCGALFECVHKMPFEITYSQDQLEEVKHYYFKNYYYLISFVDSGYCPEVPETKKELEEILENYFDIQINIIYKGCETSNADAYVNILEFNRTNIYVNRWGDYQTTNCMILAHEIRHLKGDINEAKTSFNAAKELLKSENIFLQASGAKFIYNTINGCYDEIYDFTQLVCQDYYNSIN